MKPTDMYALRIITRDYNGKICGAAEQDTNAPMSVVLRREWVRDLLEQARINENIVTIEFLKPYAERKP